MKVEPTGIVLHDVCTVQTHRCIARSAAAITAVWGMPSRIQINVCRPCLEEQVRSGEWEIEGARIEKRADVAVYSPDNRLQLIVEVKKSPAVKTELRDWAGRIHRNLLAHAGIPRTPYFLIVIPQYLYLWKDHSAESFDRPPDYEINGSDIFQQYYDQLSTSPDKANERQLESMISQWLQDLVESEPAEEESLRWFYESGLYDATKNGSVLVEHPIAA